MRTHDNSPHAPSADIATTGVVLEMTNAATLLLFEQLNKQGRIKGQWYKARWPTYLEGMQGIISCNIQRGTTRVVTQSSIRPQDVAHVLWVVLANALLQVISSSLQQSSIVTIIHAMAAFCIRIGQG